MAEQAAPAESPGHPTGSLAGIGDIIAWQEEIFAARQPESRRLAGRAASALARGVTSSWQATRPQPVWLIHGRGSKIYSDDGNEYVNPHGREPPASAGDRHSPIHRPSAR